MYKKYAILLMILLVLPEATSYTVKGYSDHPNLFVSAENSIFQNHFSGAMVIEVIVREDNTQLDQAIGEPNVSINGMHLRMVQSNDGNWYAFFADLDSAKQASAISTPGGVRGQNLDFGDFCSASTPSSVLGADFSQTDGIAIPPGTGLTGTSTGLSSFSTCSGTPHQPSSNPSVLRNPPYPNTNSNVPTGQIGINTNVWPVIQLFTLSNTVHIQYDKSTGSQSVDLDYSDIPNISLNLDRQFYPPGSEVFAEINDIQLNEDPTSIDSWTFNVSSPEATFYQAFPEYGSSSTAPVNIGQYLPNLGFRDNGRVTMNLGNVVNLKTNLLQTSSSITAGGTNYNHLVTFAESGPNTGVFDTGYSGISTIGILQNAPRSQSGSIEYNLRQVSIVSGTSTASLTLGAGQGTFGPGQRETVTLTDQTLVSNSKIIETLDDFRSSVKIPTLKIGQPITLIKSSDVNFYTSPGLTNPVSVQSSIDDSNSARLTLNTPKVGSVTHFYAVTINLGITTQDLKNLFIDTSQSNSNGTNWINYDLRSFQDLGINSFSSVSMRLHFGSATSSSSVQIVSSGNMASGNGLVQIDDSTISSIESEPSSSPVYLEINFDSSGGEISNEVNTQPIVFDLFSFGNKNGQTVNNAMYRAELQETSPGSGTFTGTIEYVVTNQLNQFDPNLIKSLRTFGSNIKFLVNSQMVDQNGINFSISGIEAGQSTIVTSKSNLPTTTGVVTLDSSNYKIGSVVTITVKDPDLSGGSGTIQSFNTVNDPNSPAVDTVGYNGQTLLEVWIKGFRFHRCTINGVTYGGLASTGFTLTETSPGSGVFVGTFKIPQKICSEDGTELISPVGGSVEAWYHDFMDQYGRSIVVHSTVPSVLQTYAPSIPPAQQNIPSLIQSTQVTDSNGRPILENPKAGQELDFKSTISYNGINTQNFLYVLQVKDSQGQVVYLKWIAETVSSSGSVNVEIPWTPAQPGLYSGEIYLWSDMTSPLPLSEIKEYKLNILPS